MGFEFALINSDLLLINIMEKDFEKQSPKEIDTTKKNKEENSTMIHPSTLSNASQLMSTGASPTASPGSTVASSVGKTVDPNHFPTHLYKMLEEIDNAQGAAAATVEGKTFAQIVSWQPHGKCLLIHDEDMFSKYVLPKYFCRLKFTSFQRQLHFHGFKRLCKQGPDKGAYYHDLFARGMPEVATYIQRIKSSKGLRGRKRKSQDQEPDFYKQASSPTLPAVIAAKSNTSVSPQCTAPEPPKLSLPTNEAPLPSHVDDATDMVRLEPTPIGQMRPVQSEQIPAYREMQSVTLTAQSSKRQRREVQPCNPSVEESKFSNRRDMAAMQQILQQEVDAGLRDARSTLPDLSDRTGSFLANPTSGMGVPQMMNMGAGRNEDDFWQLGNVFGNSMERGEACNTLGNQQLPSLALTQPLDLELEPAPIQFSRPGQQQLQLQGQQHMQQQHQYEAEDQLQEQILRQIEEQQRQLRQQRETILQRQQLQQRQRQMDSMFQDRLEPFGLQQQQQQPQQNLLLQRQQQQLGMSDPAFPFQQQLDDHPERLGNSQLQQQRSANRSPQNEMQRFQKHT